MTTTSAMWDTAPYQAMRDGLAADGWQVVTIDLPYASELNPTLPGSMNQQLAADVKADPGHGAAYNQRWLASFAATLERTGPAARTIVVGVSWGGYNALLAACHNPTVNGYLVHEPVADPSLLSEFTGIDSSGLTLDGCAAALKSRPGAVGYGELDSRVGWKPAAAFAAAAGATVFDWPLLAHETTAATVAAELAWVRATFPPLAAPAPAPAPVPAPVVPVPVPAPPATVEEPVAAPAPAASEPQPQPAAAPPALAPAPPVVPPVPLVAPPAVATVAVVSARWTNRALRDYVSPSVAAYAVRVGASPYALACGPKMRG
jgi:pimeloyl-ACP methyl ester carboxylesterase